MRTLTLWLMISHFIQRCISFSIEVFFCFVYMFAYCALLVINRVAQLAGGGFYVVGFFSSRFWVFFYLCLKMRPFFDCVLCQRHSIQMIFFCPTICVRNAFITIK